VNLLLPVEQSCVERYLTPEGLRCAEERLQCWLPAGGVGPKLIALAEQLLAERPEPDEG
jgi:hypothetical protein